MQIKEIMTPNPACCTPDSTIQEVARMMHEHDCGCIPVVNNLSEMKPVGTITDRDVTIRTIANNQNPLTMKAGDIMTTDVATITPETTLEQCFDVMEDREIRRVLVVDERGRCCGIVAQADVVQSGVNPIRANRVIREISESSPSQHRGASRRQNYRAYLRHSVANSGSLLPLLVGIGSGVALTYLYNTRQNSGARRSAGNINDTFESEFVNAGDHENFSRYVDAEQEIEKRQQSLKDKFDSARMENDLSMNNVSSASDREDETVVNIARHKSARQGNS